MTSTVKTYGEFIDLVEKTEADAQMLLGRWKRLATKEEWIQYRLRLLTKGLVVSFVDDMAKYFRLRIEDLGSDDYIEDTIEAGHKFLKEIYGKAKECGIEVEIKKIDLSSMITDVEMIT